MWIRFLHILRGGRWRAWKFLCPPSPEDKSDPQRLPAFLLEGSDGINERQLDLPDRIFQPIAKAGHVLFGHRDQFLPHTALSVA